MYYNLRPSDLLKIIQESLKNDNLDLKNDSQDLKNWHTYCNFFKDPVTIF